MASGSSRRANHSGITNPVKESVGTLEVKKGVISVENPTDKQSSKHLLSELEQFCCNLDKSIGELRSCNRGESESKLKSLERHIQEVHKCVGEELAKLHLAQKDPSSSSGGQNEERTSAPSSEPQFVTAFQLDGHDHQQHQPPDQPSLPRQSSMESPKPSSVPLLPATQTPQVIQQGLQPYQQLPAQTAQTAPIAGKANFFCRLITNSLRALEKVQTDDHKGNRELSIHVDLNKTQKTMSIIDNGIGMKKAELEMYLCGTDGVLCSALVAADKIVVTTKHDEDERYVCEASRGGEQIIKIDRDDVSETSSSLGGRGTKITLFLKDDHLEYLEERRLQGLVIKHTKYINYQLSIRNYDSSNKWQGELVHTRGCLGWTGSTPIVSSLESYLLESFPADEVDALKKQIEKKKKSSKGEVSFEEKKKELERLRKVMVKVVGKKVEKVVVSEGSVFPKMACTLSKDPKSKAIIIFINPWEPHGILDWLAELVDEDRVKYSKVLKKFITLLVTMAAVVGSI